MPSPFPGMNPYHEREVAWHDFHESFLPAARDLLAIQMRPQYAVRIDERVYIHELPDDRDRFFGRGEVTLSRSPRVPVELSNTATQLAPARVQIPAVDLERLSFLEIRDRQSWKVVTVVELLSPTNKYAGPDREQYLAKRAELLRSDVHLVELDLLRGGPRLPLDELPECDYYVLVSRAEECPSAELWPLRLRDRLPTIPVPLHAGHADAQLPVQELLHRVYDSAGYHDYVYDGPPEPRLSAEDAAWAEPLLAAATA